jgi:hypothetical protein
MADGFHIELDEQTAERLKAAAAEAGISPSEYVAYLVRGADHSLAEDQARWAEYERTGIAFDAEPVLEEFRRKVADAVAKRS